MTERTYRRYTNLASLLHILRSRCLTLLNPETWDDRNDAFFMAEYKRIKNLKTLLAICLAVWEETYHHWQVFSRGSDGVCIEFDGEMLKSAFSNTKGVTHKLMDYRLLTAIQKMENVDPDLLPFIKRWPYTDESEYRAVFADKDDEKSTLDVPINLQMIKRITLSPWLHQALVPAVKETIKGLRGCDRLKVSRSTLIDNSQWKKLTGRVTPPVPPS